MYFYIAFKFKIEAHAEYYHVVLHEALSARHAAFETLSNDLA